MAARRITTATMAAVVVALVLLSFSTGGLGGVICGSHPCAGPCPVPDICGGNNDACAAWCISEKFDTGACYGDPKVLRICMCEREC